MFTDIIRILTIRIFNYIMFTDIIRKAGILWLKYSFYFGNY